MIRTSFWETMWESPPLQDHDLNNIPYTSSTPAKNTLGAPVILPFLGSSRNSGKCDPDFQGEILVILEPVGHSLYHFDFVLDAFQKARVQSMAWPWTSG